MTIAIIAHVKRAARAAELQRACDGSVVFLDDGTLGAANNHLRAIVHAAEVGEPLLAIEDDAILTPDFGARVRDWIDRFPDRLTSFYLGTGGAEAWHEEIDQRTAVADAQYVDHIELPQLLHAVCYFLPAPALVLPLVNLNDTAADYRLGDAWRQATGTPVLYPTTSLVDHSDVDWVNKDESLRQIMAPRHARRLATV